MNPISFLLALIAVLAFALAPVEAINGTLSCMKNTSTAVKEIDIETIPFLKDVNYSGFHSECFTVDKVPQISGAYLYKLDSALVTATKTGLNDKGKPIYDLQYTMFINYRVKSSKVICSPAPGMDSGWVILESCYLQLTIVESDNGSDQAMTAALAVGAVFGFVLIAGGCCCCSTGCSCCFFGSTRSFGGST